MREWNDPLRPEGKHYGTVVEDQSSGLGDLEESKMMFDVGKGKDRKIAAAFRIRQLKTLNMESTKAGESQQMRGVDRTLMKAFPYATVHMSFLYLHLKYRSHQN